MFPITMIQAKAHEAGLEFLLIGGHAVNLYATPQATLDVDLLIRNFRLLNGLQSSPWKVIPRIMMEAISFSFVRPME